MSQFRLIWKGLWRNPVRTLLTFGSMAVAFLLFGLLNGINQGLEKVTESFHLDRLYVMNRVSMYHPVILAFVPRIAKLPGVIDVAYWAYFVGYYRQPNVQLPIVAADVDRIFRLYPELKIAPDQLDMMRKVRPGAIVSKSIATRFGWKLGDRVPVKSAIWERKDGNNVWFFDIVGIYEPQAASPALNDLFFVNLSYFDEARTFGAGAVHLVIARIDDPRNSAAIAQSIDSMFENSPFQTRTRNEQAYARVHWRQLNELGLIANAIVGAALLTLILVASSAMMQSVRQRFPEFAVLMTLGFSPLHVAALVIAESLLLCAVAASVGLTAATISFPFVGNLFGAMKMSPEVLLTGIGVAVVVALVSAALPALRAKRLSIVDALASR